MSVPRVLLTGGGSGIGLVVLGRLLKDYSACVVVLTLCETPELTALAKDYDASRLVCVYGDVCADDVVAKAVAATVSSFGGMTHLLSCVGTMLPVEAIRDVPIERFKRIYEINLFSVVSLVQKALPHLTAAASSPTSPTTAPTVVIVTSGVDLDVYYRGWSGYCSSKAALTRFIHLLAHEEPTLRVFGVLPLVTQSPMVDLIFGGAYDGVMLPEERARFDYFRDNDMIEPPSYIADAMVKAAMGELTADSPEVEREVAGALFVGSLYQKRDKSKDAA